MIKSIGFIILTLSISFVLGCSIVHESKKNELYSDLEIEAENVNLAENITTNATLYFLNDLEDKFMPEIHTINVPTFDLREEYVISSLLNGPTSTELSKLPDTLKLDRIETLYDVINVYLTGNDTIAPDDYINIKLAMAATLSDLTEKKYVNVFINDKQLPYLNDLPTGVFQKVTNDIGEERISFIDKSLANNPELYATLYFLDSSEQYLMPEVRRLVFQQTEYVKTLFNQLISGPEDSYDHKPSLDNSIELINYFTETDSKGDVILTLELNKKPQIISKTGGEENDYNLALAAITYTMLDFIPNIDGIKIQTNNETTDDIIYKKNSFGNILGSNINMYLPGGSSATFLTPVERVVEENLSNNLTSIISELIKGPQNTDSVQALAAVPDNITINDINNIYVADNIAVVDFNRSILNKTKNLTREEEFVMLFSIINTLTNFDGIKSVQFLVDGKRVDYINDGWINIKNPLIKNPGINRYND